jgi:O-acetylhomoserine/O-acetylserine sulfhydrylase-like pyridoxal-dependent enzyme
MKRETMAVQGGYDGDPATRSVAVPIYQTVAYGFESADQAAALLNVEADGYRCRRISNPTTTVLERGGAEFEGGQGSTVRVSTGQAVLYYPAINLTELGTSIVSVLQLYGTTHTLFAHILPNQGVNVCIASSDHSDAIERLIDSRKYLCGNTWSLMTFGIQAGFEAAKCFYDGLNLITRLVNLGEAKSQACHPASTTHRQIFPEEQHRAGVTPDAIWLSIGIEHSGAIIADLDQALSAA